MLARLKNALSDRYDVDRELGAGGMATVFLARDLKHDRLVALKVLKPELGAVLGVERFLSEIKVTANLQHPNLLPLFDSGEADGLLFYVMPYVEGETLRARLEREKQLPVDDALRIATAIASALSYAHAHDVIHRDLKPENILMQAGQPVIADFGIALAVSNAGGARVTQTGLSLGTPQYMSPEQATGDRAIDGRTDIYSLGAVTYEMLVGDPPHTASTAQAIIAKVLTERPVNVRTARPAVSDEVAYAIEKSLEKLPADRWSTAHAFAEALQGRAGAGTAHAAHYGDARSARWSLRKSPAPWIVAFAMAAVVAVMGWARGRAPSQGEVVRFDLQPAPGTQFAYPVNGVATFLALSPDGSRIVFTASRPNAPWSLYVRHAADLVARPLPGTEFAIQPAFSPDGGWIAFVAPDGTLKKIGVDGSGLASLCVVGPAGAAGITWISDHEIVFANANLAEHGLWRVSSDGGAPRRFTQFDTATGERLQYMPHAVPGGKLVLYSSGLASAANLKMAVAELATGRVTVFSTLLGAQALGVAEGHLIYVRSDGALMAAPFDQRALRVGAPVQILDSVAVRRWEGSAALSANGTLAYQKGGVASQLVSVDEHGVGRVLLDSARSYAHPRLSPDGRRLAFEVQGVSDVQVWVFDLSGHTSVRLTHEAADDRPEWTPDGTRVMYSTTHTNPQSLWWQPADGSAAATQVLADQFSIREGVFTPDGQAIVYRVDTDTANRDILMVRLASERKPVPLLSSVNDEKMPRVSPDSKWLAYVSNESGREEVYLRALSGAGGRVLVSADGGGEPLWSRDGRRLFYRSGSKLMAATITTLPALGVTTRALLFDIPFATDQYHPNYDVGVDGRSFVMVRPLEASRQTVMVVNWVVELKRRVGESR